MTIQPGANLYTQGFGSRPESVEVPHIENRAPSASDYNYPIGKRWIDRDVASYELIGISTSNGITAANWNLLASDTGPLDTLTGDSGGAISPTAGNITLAGTGGQIATAGGGSTITFSLTGPYTPSTYTAHGVLLGEGASPIVATAAGTNGQLLIGSTGADPAFSTVTSSGGTITVTGGAHTLNLDLAAPVTVPNGGTGATTLTGVLTGNGTGAVTANAVTNHGVVVGGASNAVGSTAVGATGTLLAGVTGADPAFTGSPSVSGTVTAGTGITSTTGNIVATAGAVNAGTSITATLGAITATNGNLVMGTAGNKIIVPTGANASAGTSGAMSGTPGAVTVATTACSDTAKVFYARNVTGGTPGEVSITAQDGTGFTLTSTGNETSTFNWWIINA
jgi:hypothetical protein